MGNKSKIQWTEATWNPVTGCTKVSPGCKHCYAETLSKRFGKDFSKVELHPERLNLPLHWKKPRRVFVNSMSDLFHETIPTDFQDSVFAIMALACEHEFQILTKRPAEMLRYIEQKDCVCIAEAAPEGYPCSASHIEDLEWPLPNVWLGVSVENQAAADERIPALLQTPAAVRFLSVEPLLEPVDLAQHLDRGADYYGQREWRTVDWVIVGGESGAGARPCGIEWIRDIVRQCKAAGVSCFVKQIGSHPDFGTVAPVPMFDRKGGDPAEWPEDLRVREYPDARAQA